MSLSFDIDEQRVKQLANDIDTQGYAVLEGAVSDADLEQMRAYTDLHADMHPGEYFAYHGEQSLTGSMIYAIWEDPKFKALLSGLYQQAAGKLPGSDQIFPVLRCVQGHQGVRESNTFHFDASLVTALIPIFIPEKGQERGDLILFPNLRTVHNNVTLNVIEKSLFQNSFSRKVVCGAINRGWLKPDTLLLEPGNVYFFWGYRSLHTNRAVGLNLKRATALFHFGDPHDGSKVMEWILKFNQRRARMASRKASNQKQQPTPG